MLFVLFAYQMIISGSVTSPLLVTMHLVEYGGCWTKYERLLLYAWNFRYPSGLDSVMFVTFYYCYDGLRLEKLHTWPVMMDS